MSAVGCGGAGRCDWLLAVGVGAGIGVSVGVDDWLGVGVGVKIRGLGSGSGVDFVYCCLLENYHGNHFVQEKVLEHVK